MLQVRNPEQVALLAADFQLRREPNFAWKSACSAFLALPGLRGFWPMSSFDENGDAFDLSGQGRILSYNGNPTYNFDGLAPYIDLDGTGDYLSRADEAGLDILGTEFYVASAVRGLTLGGWFWLGSKAANQSLMGKWKPSTNERSYMIYYNSTSDEFYMAVSTDGTAIVQHPTTTSGISTGAWHSVFGRFVPSTSVDIWLNGVKYSLTVGVPASLDVNAAAFLLGGYDPSGDLTTGRLSMCFLCAAGLSDSIVGALFQQTRAMYGV